MGNYATNAIQLAVLSHILEGHTGARIVGPLGWLERPGQVVIGTVPVAPGLEACSDARVRVTLLGQRPSQIRMQFLGNGVPLRRVDVNDRHGPTGPIGVHLHTYDPRTGRDNPPEELDDFPAPAIQPGLPLEMDVVRAGYERFLSMCGIRDQGSWTNPPPPLGTGEEQ